jgi:thymidylate kinase
MNEVIRMLEELKIPFIETREPGSPYSIVCTRIREILQHIEITDEMIYAGLYDIDRRIHLFEVVEKHLKKDLIVLSDRCIISSQCYQEIKIKELRDLNKEKFISLNPFIFYIDIDKETVYERSTLENMNSFEQNIFTSRIDNIFKNYKEIIPQYNNIVINNRTGTNVVENAKIVFNTILDLSGIKGDG